VLICGAYLSVVVVHIHLHLSDILMGDLTDLEIDQYKAVEKSIIEYEIYIEVIRSSGESLLPSYEGKSLAELE
jgi:hypothetical protein